MVKSVSLSIIVPVHNAEPYLAECITSILHQQFCDFELILVDDGSTDQSSVICDTYAKSDERIRVIHQSNTGAAIARLHGIQNAKGKYLGFVDGDDWIDPDMYSTMMDTMTATQADVVISGYFYDTDSSSTTILPTIHETPSDQMICNFSLMSSYWNKLIKKDLFTVDMFPTQRRINMYEDNFVIFKLLHCAKKIEYMPQAFYHYRAIANSQSHTHSQAYYDDMIYVIQDQESYIKKNNLVDVYAKYLCNEKLNIKLKLVDSTIPHKYRLARETFVECNHTIPKHWRGFRSRLKLKLVLLHMDFLLPLFAIIDWLGQKK